MMDLHRQFIQLGREKKKLTHRLCSMLPGIYEKEIYKRHGYETIYTYAWQLAGLSKGVVEKVLRTARRLKAYPTLTKKIETVGIHKVALVASVVTPETEHQWAEKTETMSKGALQGYVKEVTQGNQGALFAESPTMTIHFDEETQYLFEVLKKRYGKCGNREALKKMLRELCALTTKKEPAKPRSSTVFSQSVPGDRVRITSRHIPAAVKRAVLEKTHHRCAYPGCGKPYDQLHHRRRFGEEKNHDSVIPLCAQHHEYAHHGLIHHEQHDPSQWRLHTVPPATRSHSDHWYQQYKRG